MEGTWKFSGHGFKGQHKDVISRGVVESVMVFTFNGNISMNIS